MLNYSVRYVHKISPSDKDVGPEVSLPGSAFENRRTLAAALRERRILISGQRLSTFRAEGDKVICFPVASVWHAIVLTHIPKGDV